VAIRGPWPCARWRDRYLCGRFVVEAVDGGQDRLGAMPVDEVDQGLQVASGRDRLTMPIARG